MTRTCEACGTEHALSEARCPTCHAHPPSTARAIALLGLLSASPGAMAEPDAPVAAVYGPPPSYDEPLVEGDVAPVDLVAMEPRALLGRLTAEHQEALERLIADAVTPVDKERPSKLLIANAEATADKEQLALLFERHLTEIDSKSPDIAYKFALLLSKKGVDSAEDTLRWADVALENKDQWTGDTLKARVYGLYKLQAIAADELWSQATRAHTLADTEESLAAAEAAQQRTVAKATLWLEAAKASGRDTEDPERMLRAAGGSP